MTGWLLPSDSSAAFLPEDASLRRRPRAPNRRRPEDFERDRFEGRALVYDAFWHADGSRILLVGPPALNLVPIYGGARYRALPSGIALREEYHSSLSVMLTALLGAPADTSAVEMTFGNATYVLPVKRNVSSDLSGACVLFTMSRDNDLAWIREWADYHARVQGTNAIVFFDNGSIRYALDEVAATLKSVAGIRHAAVLSWPHRYGATDPAVKTNPYYGLFLQVASMSVALRRYAASAYGLLNCDIDELAATPAGTTIYELAHAARKGLVVMRGQFVEAIADGAAADAPTHRDFHMRLRNRDARLSRPRKWALDPTRPWVEDLGVHPYMHWIEGRPAFGKTTPAETFYWHFRGISTNWKDRRTDASHLTAAEVEADQRLAAVWGDSALSS